MSCRATVKVLMCCSNLTYKGGMVSVVKNYLHYDKWDEFKITFIPTHIETNRVFLIVYFVIAYIKILFVLVFRKTNIVYLHVAERGSVYRKALILNLSKLLNKKVVLHHHGAEFEEFYNSLDNKKKKFVKGFLEKADVNIVLSKKLVNMIKKIAPDAKIEVLYNAVNVPKKNPYNMNGTVILFLGRLGKRKGTYDLLKAIKLLNPLIDNKYKFALCGNGDIDQIRNAIKDASLSERIERIGWISCDEKSQLFKKVIINVLPSYNEGLPMSILETMAYGIPNISTNIASIPEVISDNENGYLIEPGQIEVLANRIEELIYNNEKRKTFSDNAWGLINSGFSLDSSITHLKTILRRL